MINTSKCNQPVATQSPTILMHHPEGPCPLSARKRKPYLSMCSFFRWLLSDKRSHQSRRTSWPRQREKISADFSGKKKCALSTVYILSKYYLRNNPRFDRAPESSKLSNMNFIIMCISAIPFPVPPFPAPRSCPQQKMGRVCRAEQIHSRSHRGIMHGEGGTEKCLCWSVLD